ncbi:hypothetical protein JCGZ_14884 [Jatropha curcas]|uniref:DUF309 domain-containing protein n=1 Tax=Jatropha curcas TaxID=180498 RepID=A0A067K6M5_JATCU|nr:uncharacterized protein LOC105640017 [Jatropha curcas]KDP31727.1 hypothetical protein JCGZ_14884 [Jatropha curcas]
MAFGLKFLPLPSIPPSSPHTIIHSPNYNLSLTNFPYSATHRHLNFQSTSSRFRVLCRYNHSAEEEENTYSFDEAVGLFNRREYYKCHDLLEALWIKAEDPNRTLLHGILQCAVGFHHLFNQNHKGAMLELGEGVCKLRKMNFESGPFHQFEQDISAVLEFIYQTQIELAACTDDLCIAMDRSERSYQLLGGYGAGQLLYTLEIDPMNGLFIVFCPQRSYASADPPRVKLPTLQATQDHLMSYGSSTYV